MASNILFAFSNIGSFRLHATIALRSQQDGNRAVLLYTGSRDATFSVIEAEAGSRGLAVRAMEEAVIEAAGTEWMPPRSLSPRRMLLKLVAKRRASVLFDIQQAAVLAAGRLLRHLKPDAILVSEDGISGPMALLAAARLQRIPVIDIPYGCADREDFEKDLDRKAAADDLKVASGSNGTLIRLLCPEWIKTGKRAGALMFSPEFTLASAAAGIELRNAWIVHGGNSVRVCAQSEKLRAQYAAEGIAADKLVLTGTPYCDDMIDGLRADKQASEALLKARHIQPGRLKLLVSWPPSYHEGMPETSEFATYEGMTREVLGYLNALPGVELTLSVHPAAGPGILSVLDELGIEPTSEHVVRLLARHDVIIPYYSTTTHWALAAGKVVANYDAYKLGLTQFDSAPGFLNTNSFETLKQLLGHLSDPEEYAKIAARQASDAHRWGILDGECTARALAESYRAISMRQQTSSL
ncbi:hypothetical protein [Devosia ginsengisoli]|uniref:Uncharacterized protein n=1 Tax=Devosia ginsengisoli TaxID=400770 RepID=A0A5B8LUY0_9HYPH|nr:hypothetical protein [Devosia ginsengisoli]QDZ11621.1 hypothetical protein FPZ08_13160 [Devosia ginsengisoli]